MSARDHAAPQAEGLRPAAGGVGLGIPDPRVEEPLGRFHREIRSIGRAIGQRNTSRRPYEFLVPSGIPQSINI